MRVWRLCRGPFADLSGEGARLHGGRWNSRGRPAVYAARDAALAVLEVRVHLDLDFDLLPEDYVLIGIDLPEDPAVPGGPRRFSRARGDSWLDGCAALALQLPSVIVAESANVIINPRHPAITAAKIVGKRRFAFDPRLWSVGAP